MTPGTEIVPEQLLLSPKGATRLNTDLPVDNSKLIAWWTSHLQRDEKTDLTARLEIVLVLSRDLLQTYLGNFPGSEELLRRVPRDVVLHFILVPGLTCHISTDILGAINYQIAQELKVDAGREPQAVAVDCPTPGLPVLGE